MKQRHNYKTKKPLPERVSLSEAQSFFVEKVPLLHLNSKWHFHEDNEIIFIPMGKGTVYIGDGRFTFSEGILIMIGSYTPHIWVLNNEFTPENPNIKEEAVVIKFRESLFGNHFIQYAGTDRVKSLIEKSKHGIIFTGDKVQPLKNKLKTFNKFDCFDKLLFLLDILNVYSKSSTYTLVSTSVTLSLNQKKELSNIDKILKFIDANFKHKITIKEIAEIANLSPTSFCRYFKARTDKSFITAVNEVRIDYAVKLLLETNLSATEICYLCGFNQLSNFYRQFARKKKMTPAQLRKNMHMN